MSSWQQIQKSTNFTPSISQVDDFQTRPFAVAENEHDNENQEPIQSTATKLNWSFGDIPVSRKEAFSGDIQPNLKLSQKQESDRLFLGSQPAASEGIMTSQLIQRKGGPPHAETADRHNIPSPNVQPDMWLNTLLKEGRVNNLFATSEGLSGHVTALQNEINRLTNQVEGSEDKNLVMKFVDMAKTLRNALIESAKAAGFDFDKFNVKFGTLASELYLERKEGKLFVDGKPYG